VRLLYAARQEDRVINVAERRTRSPSRYWAGASGFVRDRLAEKASPAGIRPPPSAGAGGAYVSTTMVNKAVLVDHAITEVVQSLLCDEPTLVRRAIGARHGHAD
jgi:hypothetical protein